MTAKDRAAAVVSKLIAANLIAAPFDDTPDPTYYARLVAAFAEGIREDRAEIREKAAEVAESQVSHDDPDDAEEEAFMLLEAWFIPSIAAAIRDLPLD